MTQNKPTDIEERVKEISKKAHIKWLSKCKTAVINGNEMTVLPYGYFQTAIEEVLREAIREAREDTLNQVEEHMVLHAGKYELYGEWGKFKEHRKMKDSVE